MWCRRCHDPARPRRHLAEDERQAELSGFNRKQESCAYGLRRWLIYLRHPSNKQIRAFLWLFFCVPLLCQALC